MTYPSPSRHTLRTFQILYRLFLRSDSKSSMDCPSTPAAPLFSLTLLYASHTSHFDISNDLSFGPDLPTRFLPEHRLVARASKTTDEPAPSLHPHYRDFITNTGRSASKRRIGTQHLTVSAAWRAPSYRPAPFQARRRTIGTHFPKFHAEAADQTRAAFTPDTAWPVKRDTRQTHPGTLHTPRF